MLKRMLKKDMRRRKSVNIILFLFITIASIFLASSVNNILVVVSSVDYYMDYANVPDVNLIATSLSEKEQIAGWIEEKGPGVTGYDSNTLLALSEKGIAGFHSNGVTMYLAVMDSDYCKVFEQDGRKFTLEPGEAAMARSMMEENSLKEGDNLVVSLGKVKKSLTIKAAMKDAAFGSEMVGISRLMVSQEDFQEFSQDNDSDLLGMYYVDTDRSDAFIKELNNQGFTTIMNSITRSTYSLVYSFDMIMAALLILIGICLILIALLVLRFTLVFTIEEDFREIGIMKAIGLKDFAIKKLYLAKYLILVLAGSLLGLMVSIPVSQKMVQGVSRNMIMEDSSANIGVNILCTLLIIVLVMLFCYHCTGKLNKISAISAIRSGQTGETYGRGGRFSLHRRKRMRVPAYLGFNDMFSHPRRFLVLMFTFCISFILITIPLNTINTMQSREMTVKFAIDPDSAAYVKKIEGSEEHAYRNSSELKKGLERIEAELEEKGYQAELTAIPIFFLSYGEKGQEDKTKIMTIQLQGPNNDYLACQEGTSPVLANEIAFSSQVLEENDWEIGDTVETSIDGQTEKFLITGTYSDYLQLGKSARLNPRADLDREHMFDYWNIMVDMDTEQSQEETVRTLNRLFPDYEWYTAQGLVAQNVGGIQQNLEKLLVPMTAMLCAVIMLITLLMERLFIVREKGEIAMMKSMGYKNRTIRQWQVLRMVWVALASMVAAIPLSLLCNRWILKPIFAIMGADVDIQVISWQVYGLYPGILLVGIIAATGIGTGKVKKINIRELNNLE